MKVGRCGKRSACAARSLVEIKNSQLDEQQTGAALFEWREYQPAAREKVVFRMVTVGLPWLLESRASALPPHRSIRPAAPVVLEQLLMSLNQDSGLRNRLGRRPDQRRTASVGPGASR